MIAPPRQGVEVGGKPVEERKRLRRRNRGGAALRPPAHRPRHVSPRRRSASARQEKALQRGKLLFELLRGLLQALHRLAGRRTQRAERGRSRRRSDPGADVEDLHLDLGDPHARLIPRRQTGGQRPEHGSQLVQLSACLHADMGLGHSLPAQEARDSLVSGSHVCRHDQPPGPIERSVVRLVKAPGCRRPGGHATCGGGIL